MLCYWRPDKYHRWIDLLRSSLSAQALQFLAKDVVTVPCNPNLPDCNVDRVLCVGEEDIKP